MSNMDSKTFDGRSITCKIKLYKGSVIVVYNDFNELYM